VTTVLVTDASRGSAVATIRALARSGHRVVAADSLRVSAGRWSRHAAASVRYPDPSHRPRDAGEALCRAVAGHRVDVVVPVTDAAIAALEAVAGELPDGCRVAVAPAAQLDQVRHKAATLALAESVGVPVPRSRLVRTGEEALAAAAGFGWPVVLKPERSTVATGGGELAKLEVAYAAGPGALARRMADFEGRSAVLVQEFCGGVGEGVEVLAHEGRVLAAFQHRRLREVPFSGGASSLRESVPLDGELFRHSAALIGALGWTGVAMVEFKSGPAGPRLMEVNGRLWGSLPLAVRAGVDFPTGLVELATGGPAAVSPGLRGCGAYRVGVRSRNVRLEVLWAVAALSGRARHPVLPGPSRRDGLAVLVRLFRPADGYDILSWRDPAPGLAELLQLAAKVLPTRGGGPMGAGAADG
jgi:predicted ATP-grasp superfamily ATP-dependent carboligase